jgi:hypothetical protein
MNDMLREQDSLSNILYIKGTMDHPNEHCAHNWKKPTALPFTRVESIAECKIRRDHSRVSMVLWISIFIAKLTTKPFY